MVGSRSFGAVLVAAIVILGFGRAEASTVTTNFGSIDHTMTESIGEAADSNTYEYIFTVNHDATLTAAISVVSGFSFDLQESHDRSGYNEVPIAATLTSVGGDLVLGFENALAPGHIYSLEFNGMGGAFSGDLTFTFASVAAAPIPPALLMFGTALTGLFGVGWMRRRRSA
jgi:hypothetical protein